MASRKRDVYVIESTADVPRAVERIRELSGDHAYIYMPHRFKQLVISDYIGPTSGLKVLPFETINADIDDKLYGYAQAIGSSFAKHMAEPAHRWAFYVSLQDLIVSRIRPVVQLRYYQERMPIGRVFWLPNEPAIFTHLWELLSTGIPGARVAGDFYPVKHIIDGAVKMVGTGKRRILDPIQLDAAIQERGKVVVTCALKDPQYRNTILPFVSRMLKTRDVVLIPSASLGDDQSMATFFKEHRLNPLISNGRLTILDKTVLHVPDPLEWPEVLRMASIARRQTTLLEGHIELDRVFGGIARDVAMVEGPRIAGECKALWTQAVKLAEASSIVVVCPGRPMRSTLLVAAAKSVGRRSIEIQSGTIAKNRRFVAPQADRVLVMDEESKDTYAFLGRTKGVEIVGSIRLDYDLATFRNVTKEQARRQLNYPADRELWVLASQPVGVDLMRNIAEIIFEAAKTHGADVMVKMHPNETPAYEAAYRGVAKKHRGLNVLVERKAKSVLAVLAADIVLTHFSTVGIEAYALGRTTVAVNPLEERPTFDLAKMGVAQEARSAGDLLAIAQSRTAEQRPTGPLTDGRVLDRCQRWVTRLAIDPDAAPSAALAPIELHPELIEHDPIPLPQILPTVSPSAKKRRLTKAYVRQQVDAMPPLKRAGIQMASKATRWLPGRFRSRLASMLIKAPGDQP